MTTKPFAIVFMYTYINEEKLLQLIAHNIDVKISPL